MWWAGGASAPSCPCSWDAAGPARDDEGPEPTAGPPAPRRHHHGTREPPPRPRGLTRACSTTGPNPVAGHRRRRGFPPLPLLGRQPRRALAKLAARRPPQPWSPPPLAPQAAALLQPPATAGPLLPPVAAAPPPSRAVAAPQPLPPAAPPRPPAGAPWSSPPVAAPKDRLRRVSHWPSPLPRSRPFAMHSTSASWWGRPRPSSAPWPAPEWARRTPPCERKDNKP
jgi:hypothetical protein